MDEYNQIMAGDRPPIEKLRAGFEWITDLYLADGEREIELLRAMQDREALVKEQIKVSTVRHLRGIFEQCYRGATTGSEATHEPR
jgi:hypothetical protein